MAFSHSSPNYPVGHSAGIGCLTCHTNNSQNLAWPFSAYKPDCAGCHASTYKQDSHKKVDSPKVLYTVSELRDCTGACHMYTDSTFTTVKERRSGKHRTSGEW